MGCCVSYEAIIKGEGFKSMDLFQEQSEFNSTLGEYSNASSIL
jgi:hypothetical protein